MGPELTVLSVVKVGQRPEEAKCFIRVVKLALPFRAASLIWTHKPPGSSAFNSATFIPTQGGHWSYGILYLLQCALLKVQN